MYEDLKERIKIDYRNVFQGKMYKNLYYRQDPSIISFNCSVGYKQSLGT